MSDFFKEKSFLKTLNGGRGFTVIELVVAAAIIGVLVSVIVINLNVSRLKARNAQRSSDLAKVQLALEEYFDTYRYYPRCGGGTRKIVPDNPNNKPATTDLGGSDICDTQHPNSDFGNFAQLGVTGYLSIVPVDPLNASSQGIFYGYCYQRGYRKTGDSTYSLTQRPTDYILAGRTEDATYSGYGSPSGASFVACGKPYRNVLFGN